MGFCIHTVLKVADEYQLCKMQSKLQNFRLNLAIFVQTRNWPYLEHQMDDLFFLYKETKPQS